jgi:hypothetical protein
VAHFQKNENIPKNEGNSSKKCPSTKRVYVRYFLSAQKKYRCVTKKVSACVGKSKFLKKEQLEYEGFSLSKKYSFGTPKKKEKVFRKIGPVVHMVERFLSMEEVRGSIPLRSISFFFFFFPFVPCVLFGSLAIHLFYCSNCRV